MPKEIKKPICLEEEHLEYLDKLRESGVTNMYGASEYLEKDYPELSSDGAQSVVSYWMRTFCERHD